MHRIIETDEGSFELIRMIREGTYHGNAWAEWEVRWLSGKPSHHRPSRMTWTFTNSENLWTPF